MVEAAAVSAMDPLLRAIVTIGVLVFFAKLFSGIFSGFKLPPLIGELVAGMIFSPYALGSGILIFNEPLVVLNDYVEAFAEIGVIMILFAAGLEMGVTSIRKAGIWAFIVSFTGTTLPFLAGYYFYNFLGYPQTAVLFISTALLVTSTAIPIKFLEDFGALKTDEGLLIADSAIIDDVLGIITLAVISSIAVKGGEFNFMTTIRTSLSFFVIWLILLVIGIYVIPRIINQVTMIRAEGMVEAAAIASAFLMAAVAGGLGLSPIIGSYAAGMAVAESKALVRVKDFIRHINQIFSPIFFAVMGAHINILALLNTTMLVGILLMTSIAIITKLGPGFLFSLPKFKNVAKCIRVGVGRIPRGEIGIVVAALGLSRAFISNTLYLEITGMVILTSIIAPLILTKMYEAIEIEAPLE